MAEVSEPSLSPSFPPSFFSASVDRAGFWGTVTSYLKREKKHGISVEGGVYLDDLDDETLDPEEMSKFFPSV